MKKEASGMNNKASDQLVASIPKDQLRSMFYLFAGKPDSRIKVFEGALQLKPSDIYELNDCIIRKLRTHNIDASTTTVKVGYEGSEINEFGTWAEFENHHWQEPDKIEELVIKWDFLVNIQEYSAPQRHTLLFRVSTEVKPGKIFQLMSSGNSDDFDNAEMFTAPAFCRVDFINAHLSKELINVVSDWHRGRPTPLLIPNIYYWFKIRRQVVAEIFDNWLVLSWTLLVSSIIFYSFTKYFNGSPTVTTMSIVIFFSIYTLTPAKFMARKFAGKIYNNLRDLEGSKVVFDFTSGDKKKILELKQENDKQGRRFLGSAGWNIALNILASIIYAYLFSKGG